MRNLLLRRWAGSIGGAVVMLLLVGAAGCAVDEESRKNLATGYQSLEVKSYDAALASADQELRRAPGGPAAAEALYLRGRALEQRSANSPAESQANWNAARAAYLEALSRDPSRDLEAHIRAGLANVAYFQDDYTTALREWSDAYERFDDPATRAWILYRTGLCQQRLGRFDEADQTFAQVQEEYPNTIPAQRAREHHGARGFSVQLATYANKATAENAVNLLRREGLTPTATADAQGRTVLRVGPLPTYQQAASLKQRYASRYPDALIVP